MWSRAGGGAQAGGGGNVGARARGVVGRGGTCAVRHAAVVDVTAAAGENPALLDNWDDAEGYYRVAVRARARMPVSHARARAGARDAWTGY